MSADAAPRAHARRARDPRPDRALRAGPHPAGQGARAAVRGRAGLLGRRRRRRVVGCGAVHPLWEDIAEIRTVAVDPSVRGQGVGRADRRAPDRDRPRARHRARLRAHVRARLLRLVRLPRDRGHARHAPRSTPSCAARSTRASPSSSTSSASSRTRSATTACCSS